VPSGTIVVLKGGCTESNCSSAPCEPEAVIELFTGSGGLVHALSSPDWRAVEAPSHTLTAQRLQP
jgi:hypothetical protein